MAEFSATIYKIVSGQRVSLHAGTSLPFPDSSIIRAVTDEVAPIASSILYVESGQYKMAYASETAAALQTAANAGGGGGGGGDASAANQVTGNTSLASIDTKTPALGQALAAGSTPVVLTAAQIATLAPPAAITNFANETGGNLASAVSKLAGGLPAALGQQAAAGALAVALPNEQIQDLYIVGAASQSASGNNILLASAGTGSLDTMQPQSFRSFYIQINSSAGITTGQIIFEGSNDNTFTSPVTLSVIDEITVTGVIIQSAQNIAASTQRYFAGKISTRYIRCRISTVFAGGTIQAYTRLSTSDYTSRVFPVIQTNQANLSMSIGGVAGTTVVNGGLAGTLGVGGPVAHSAASTSNPVITGGKVVTAVDTTLVAGDVSQLQMTTDAQLVQKQFAPAELDFTFNGTILNTTTANIFKAAAGASIRNFLTSLFVDTDLLTTASELVIKDNAIAGASVAANVFTSGTHDLKIGDAVVFSVINTFTGATVGTTYYVLTVPSGTTYTLSATPGGSTLAISGTGTSTSNRILFRTKLAAAIQSKQFLFPNPLRGTPNGTMDIQTVTATGITLNIYYNVTGYTGA